MRAPVRHRLVRLLAALGLTGALVLPAVGLPAQTLRLVVSGVLTPYLTVLSVTQPDGAVLTWPLTALSSPISFGPGESGEPYFGVTQTGLWQAQAIVNGMVSNVVRWETRWFPIHVTR